MRVLRGRRRESLFKGYDVRGVYGREVTEQNFLALGQMLAEKSSEMVLGIDYRKSGLSLAAALTAGFGKQVLFLGYAPTPATAFISKELGVQITASHNPPEFNGAKFFTHGRCYWSEEVRELEKNFSFGGRSIKQVFLKENYSLREYTDALPAIEQGIFDLCGGAVCAVKKVFPDTLYGKPDPYFQKHSPEPKDETLQELKKKTLEKNEMGFAFDGDGDRVLVVDEGTVFEGDVVAAFIAENFLRKGNSIVLSIDCSQEVFNFIRDSGFRVAYSKVGDPHVVKKALETGASFAAEKSGHFMFPHFAPNSDAIYASAVLSAAKAGELKKFSEKFKNIVLKQYFLQKIDFRKLKKIFLQQDPIEVNCIDGVKAEFEEYTLLVRLSQTESRVRINCEAKTRENAEKGIGIATRLLNQCVIK